MDEGEEVRIQATCKPAGLLGANVFKYPSLPPRQAGRQASFLAHAISMDITRNKMALPYGVHKANYPT